MMKHKKHFLVAGIAALLMGSSLGLNLNTVGVYLQPIANSLDVAIGDISMHSTLISLGMAFAAFVIPPVLKRMNFRLVVLMATLATAGATYLMSLSTEIWMFNLLGLIRGISAAFFGIVALQLLINNWFISKHGMVTSVVFSFSGVVGAIFSPVLSDIIVSYGWERALLVQSLLLVLFNLPGILVPYSFHPHQEDLEPYEEVDNDTETTMNTAHTPRKPYAFASVTFLAVILFSIVIPSLPGLVQHLAGIGVDFGFSAAVGAFMISAAMVGNIVFKLAIGVIADKKGTIAAILSMIGTITMGLILILIAATDAVILTGSFLFGAVYSIAAVGLSLLVKYLYSDMEFPRVFPMVNFTSNLGGAIAVSIYGYSYDLTGGYEIAVIGSIILALLSLLLLYVADKSSEIKGVLPNNNVSG